MNYLRTKDGVIIDVVKNVMPRSLLGLHVIDEANTIEELCDEFIGIKKGGKKCFLRKWNGNTMVENWETNNTYEIKKLRETFVDVYGAIWVDTGLKYVAIQQLNGEFKLL